MIDPKEAPEGYRAEEPSTDNVPAGAVMCGISSCYGCAFFEPYGACFDISVTCMGTDRKDQTDVIFVKETQE